MADYPDTVRVFTDGCAKGNPGPAGAGFSIENPERVEIDQGREPLGRATNNEAEYQALIFAMERCLQNEVRQAQFFTDSELMAKQINGIYRIKNPRMARLAERVFEMRDRFELFQITHVRREKNKRADQLANEALELAPD